jgi:HNH endonuclease
MGHATAAEKRAQAKYQKKPLQVKKRVNRNKARRHMIKAGKAHVGDGKDVMHVNGNALDNRPSNWKVGSRSKNRSYARTRNAGKKNPRS